MKIREYLKLARSF